MRRDTHFGDSGRLKILSSLKAGCELVQEVVPVSGLDAKQGESTQAIEHARCLRQRDVPELRTAGQVTRGHLTEVIAGDFIQRAHDPQRDAGGFQSTRNAVVAHAPGLLPGPELIHLVFESPDLDYPLHRLADHQGPEGSSLIGSAKFSQSVLSCDHFGSKLQAHLGELGVLHAPGHRPQQARLLFGSPMDYWVLTHLGMVGEMRVHGGAPRPPDVIGHGCWHCGHQPLSFGHRKGTRESDPRRKVAPH
ncbi:MAG TPA: hypothetical protein VIS09_00455 [Streptomyces sp.]